MELCGGNAISCTGWMEKCLPLRPSILRCYSKPRLEQTSSLPSSLMEIIAVIRRWRRLSTATDSSSKIFGPPHTSCEISSLCSRCWVNVCRLLGSSSGFLRFLSITERKITIPEEEPKLHAGSVHRCSPAPMLETPSRRVNRHPRTGTFTQLHTEEFGRASSTNELLL